MFTPQISKVPKLAKVYLLGRPTFNKKLVEQQFLFTLCVCVFFFLIFCTLFNLFNSLSSILLYFFISIYFLLIDLYSSAFALVFPLCCLVLYLKLITNLVNTFFYYLIL